MTALLGIVLVGESVSAIPKSVGFEVAQQGAIDNKEAIRERAKQIFAQGMQLSKQDKVESRQQAIKKYEEALTLFQQADYKPGKAFTFSAIALLHEKSGEKLKALNYYSKALTLWQELKNLELQYDNLDAVGSVYSNSGAKQKALDYYNQALTLSQQIPDKQLEAETLTGIGRIYHDLGENQKALSYFQRVLTLFEQFKNKQWQVLILNNIGNVYSNLGEQQQALKHYNQALPLAQEDRDKAGEANTLNNIGAVYSALGEKQRALKFYNQALSIREKLNRKELEAESRNNIGKIYLDLGKNHQALKFYNQALPLVEEIKYKPLQATILNNIGVIYWNLGDLQRALKFYNQALSLVEEIGDQRRKISILNNIGKVYDNLEDNQQALEFYDEALTLLKDVDHKSKEADTLHNIAKTHRDNSNLQKALTNSKAAVDIIENLRTKVNSNELRTSYFATVQDIYKLYIDILMQLHKQNPSYELPKSEEIEETANKLRNLLQDRSMQGVSPEETGKTATELSKLILAPVADKLSKKRLVIVGDDALQYIPFAALADLNSCAASFPGSSQGTHSTRLCLSSVSGRQSLSAGGSQPETGNQLKARNQSDESNYQPLLINHEIVHLPSASTIDILRKETAQRPMAPKTLAVLADPVFHKDDKRVTGKSNSSSFNIDDIDVEASRSSLRNFNLNEIHALPNTRKEAEEILKLVSPQNSLKAFDFDANYNWATQKQLSQYRYLHFATHGFVHPTDPKLSGIVLSLLDKEGNPHQEGFLRSHELFNLNFPAELVVLSACKTGLGKEVKGEGLVGLTRGLMYAGAERVVVSLWNVKDDATSLLMREFYQQILQQGKSPATALREAQIKMWQTQKWRNPYSWAAFTIQGEWN